eukprot:EG_transcript_1210
MQEDGLPLEAEIQKGRVQREAAWGDALLAAAFAAYAGPFGPVGRQTLLAALWPPPAEASLPCTGQDPVPTLVDPATLAHWRQAGLPQDTASVQSAAIAHASRRSCLLVDPELHGRQWLTGALPAMVAPGGEVVVLRHDRLVAEAVEAVMAQRQPLVVERARVPLAPALHPVLGGLTSHPWAEPDNAAQKDDCDALPQHTSYRAFLHTRYAASIRPCSEELGWLTVVNFQASPPLVEEHLLTTVLAVHDAYLETRRVALTAEVDETQARLTALEVDVLQRANLGGERLLSGPEHVAEIRRSREAAAELRATLHTFRRERDGVETARDAARPLAQHLRRLHAVVVRLGRLDPTYQTSLRGFSRLVRLGVERVAVRGAERPAAVAEGAVEAVFQSLHRGLRRQHRLLFATLVAFTVLEFQNRLDPNLHRCLVAGFPPPPPQAPACPVEWLPAALWDNVLGLATLPGFGRLLADFDVSPKRWKEWMEQECPERDRLPNDWRSLGDLEMLALICALRPDRLPHALSNYLHAHFPSWLDVTADPIAEALSECRADVPLVFLNFTSEAAWQRVAKVALAQGRSRLVGNLHLLSAPHTGPGAVLDVLRRAQQRGGWVVLQHAHLPSPCLAEVEALLEGLGEPGSPGLHRDFRLFVAL